MKNTKTQEIIKELRHHLPLSLSISILAGIVVFFFYNMGKIPSENLFEVLHPAHVFVSAIATSAIYWKHKKNITKTILIGVTGAILIGSLSDVIFPYFAGNLFSLHTHFHLPIIEKTFLILSVAIFGAVLGMYSKLFKMSHLIHVALSVFASLFYLLAFSIQLTTGNIFLISAIVFIAVYIPCCISDIVFPILFLKKPCSECGHWHD